MINNKNLDNNVDHYIKPNIILNNQVKYQENNIKIIKENIQISDKCRIIVKDKVKLQMMIQMEMILLRNERK